MRWYEDAPMDVLLDAVQSSGGDVNKAMDATMQALAGRETILYQCHHEFVSTGRLTKPRVCNILYSIQYNIYIHIRAD